MNRSILAFVRNIKNPLVVALTAGCLTALFTLSMPNFYRSELRMLPVDSKPSGGSNLANAAAAFGISVPGADSSDNNYIDILQSRWLCEQLLMTQMHYHIPASRFGHETERSGSLYDYLHARNLDQAIRALGGVLNSSRDLKTKVISISAETRSPELSQAVVQRAGKLLEAFLQDKGHTRGGAKAAFAEARLAEARGEMLQAEDDLGRFMNQNRNYQTSADPEIRLKGLRLESEFRLRQQLTSAIAMNREQALMEEKNDIPILNILDSGNLPIEKSRPIRSRIVLLSTLFWGILAWLWFNRKWIQSFMVTGEEHGASEPPNGS